MCYPCHFHEMQNSRREVQRVIAPIEIRKSEIPYRAIEIRRSFPVAAFKISSARSTSTAVL